MSVKSLEQLLVKHRFHWDNKNVFYTIKIKI